MNAAKSSSLLISFSNSFLGEGGPDSETGVPRVDRKARDTRAKYGCGLSGQRFRKCAVRFGSAVVFVLLFSPSCFINVSHSKNGE